MRYRHQRMIAIVIFAALTLAACTAPAHQTSDSSASSPPARVEHIAGQDLSRVILTEQAAKRLGIETLPVRDAQVQGKLRQVVPYAAVFYDLNGKTWLYTNPEPLTFVRTSITVDNIDGDLAILSEGPSSGTKVVSVGAPELYGAEFGVGQ